MKRRHIISSAAWWILRAGVLLFLMAGCRKFVAVDPPMTRIVTASVFSNSAAATSAQLAIYIQMANLGESWNLSQNSGLLADELATHSTSVDQLHLYTNSLVSSSYPVNWGRFYVYVYRANAIIEGLQNNQNIPSAIGQQLIGESKFIRGFWYFYLTNMYGDVPLALTTDYTKNDRLGRAPRTQVYAQMIKDLSDAAILLNSRYVDATDTAVTTERTRPTKWAAYAMLARAYLYNGKFDSAKAAASQVINNTGYFQLCANLSPLMGPGSVFLKNSSEAIWQLSTPLPANWNTLDGLSFILTSAPATGGSRSVTISNQLMSSFDSGDLRKTNWIGQYKNYYFPYKYQNASRNVTEYVMVLRLAEQFLIRAEAEASLGDSASAISDLNRVRNRAGLANYDPVRNGPLLSAILHERQVELFTEWGHRWFDLIRTGNIDAVMGGPTGVCQAKGGTWATTDRLYPIPLTDIFVDPYLTQNPGYN